MKVNGRSLRLSALRSITGFVPQDDIVHDDLTVRENLVSLAGSSGSTYYRRIRFQFQSS